MDEYDKIQGMIKYENGLINQRLGWFGVLQGFLFTALTDVWRSETKFVTVIICLCGILVSLSIGLSTYGANKAINELERQWDNRRPENYAGVDVVGIRNRSSRFWRLMPGYFIPWIFMGSWLLILFNKQLKNIFYFCR